MYRVFFYNLYFELFFIGDFCVCRCNVSNLKAKCVLFLKDLARESYYILNLEILKVSKLINDRYPGKTKEITNNVKKRIMKDLRNQID